MMTNRKVMYDTPEGELILFQNADQVKEFFCKICLPPEDLEDLGIRVEFDPEEEEYICEVGKVYIAPVFNPNPYLKTKEQLYGSRDNEFYYNPEQLTLNEDIYRDYPMVAYMCYSQGFSRLGDERVKIFNISPISEMVTVNQLNKTIQDNHDTWKNNLDTALEWEKEMLGS